MRRRLLFSGAVACLIFAMAVPPGSTAPNNGSPVPNDDAQVACDNTSGHPRHPRFCTTTAVTLTVTGGGPTAGEARLLGEALDLGVLGRDHDGAVRYLDPERFQAVPTNIRTPETPPGIVSNPVEDGEDVPQTHIMDIASLLDLTVIPGDTALETINDALSAAGLLPAEADPLVTNATIRLLRNPELLPDEVPPLPTDLAQGKAIDTQVGYELRFGGIPVVGPGAKIKVSFDPEGVVSQLLYSAVQFGSGSEIEIISPEHAPELCRSVLDLPLTASLSTELVYYAPPLDQRASQLLPHFRCNSSIEEEYADAPVAGLGGTVDSRTVLIPAVVNAPRVAVSANVQQGSPDIVTAVSEVAGGTPPYTYQWSSALETLIQPFATDESVSYAVNGRGAENGGSEELILTVTDANGLQATDRAEFDIGRGSRSAAQRENEGTRAVPLANARTASSSADSTSQIDVGAEWVGTFNHAGDLPGVPGNAWGFHDVNDNYNPVQFYWGNNDAWEADFRDQDFAGGGDGTSADDVDLTFYTGHANGDGWVMESNVNDQWVGWWDTRLGDFDEDLEWLVLGACGVLQASTGGGSLAARWGPVFQGLHMILGYATVSQDTSQEGRRFSTYMRQGHYLYHSWGQQAIDIQPSSVVYGYMGPVGANYEWNAYDHFHGHGSVTGDIRNIAYYWVTTANA